MDLDEQSDQELVAELERRAALRSKGKCDYCGGDTNATACRFPSRHSPIGNIRGSCSTCRGRVTMKLGEHAAICDHCGQFIVKLYGVAPQRPVKAETDTLPRRSLGVTLLASPGSLESTVCMGDIKVYSGPFQNAISIQAEVTRTLLEIVDAAAMGRRREEPVWLRVGFGVPHSVFLESDHSRVLIGECLERHDADVTHRIANAFLAELYSSLAGIDYVACGEEIADYSGGSKCWRAKGHGGRCS